MSKIENKIDLLRKIERVDTPSFLFTRVESRIMDFQDGAVGYGRWAISSLVIVVCLNLVVGYTYLSSSKGQSSQVSTYYESSNAFYYE